jgi:hypothetical protein
MYNGEFMAKIDASGTHKMLNTKIWCTLIIYLSKENAIWFKWRSTQSSRAKIACFHWITFCFYKWITIYHVCRMLCWCMLLIWMLWVYLQIYSDIEYVVYDVFHQIEWMNIVLFLEEKKRLKCNFDSQVSQLCDFGHPSFNCLILTP